MSKIENKEKGTKGENEFKNWLDLNGLSYLYINQNPETYATFFQGVVKRPDFLVLIDSIGVISVDVKNYALFRKDSFTLEYEEEVKKVLAFERLFRIPVWYSYLRLKDGKQEWCWISALKAVEVGIREKNTQKNEDFLVIKMKEFVKIASNDDLGKLYTHRLPCVKKLKNI